MFVDCTGILDEYSIRWCYLEVRSPRWKIDSNVFIDFLHLKRILERESVTDGDERKRWNQSWMNVPNRFVLTKENCQNFFLVFLFWKTESSRRRQWKFEWSTYRFYWHDHVVLAEIIGDLFVRCSIHFSIQYSKSERFDRNLFNVLQRDASVSFVPSKTIVEQRCFSFNRRKRIGLATNKSNFSIVGNFSRKEISFGLLFSLENVFLPFFRSPSKFDICPIIKSNRSLGLLSIIFSLKTVRTVKKRNVETLKNFLKFSPEKRIFDGRQKFLEFDDNNDDDNDFEHDDEKTGKRNIPMELLFIQNRKFDWRKFFELFTASNSFYVDSLFVMRSDRLDSVIDLSDHHYLHVSILLLSVFRQKFFDEKSNRNSRWEFSRRQSARKIDWRRCCSTLFLG